VYAIIIVKLGPERPVEKKRELVKALTEDAARILEVPVERITVLIEELGSENWGSGGILHIDKYIPDPTKQK
jgi:4-oxalocrotonate tautomerase